MGLVGAACRSLIILVCSNSRFNRAPSAVSKFVFLCAVGWIATVGHSEAADDAFLVGWYIGVSAGSTTPNSTNFSTAQSWNYDAGYRFVNVSSELTYS